MGKPDKILGFLWDREGIAVGRRLVCERHWGLCRRDELEGSYSETR